MRRGSNGTCLIADSTVELAILLFVLFLSLFVIVMGFVS